MCNVCIAIAQSNVLYLSVSPLAQQTRILEMSKRKADNVLRTESQQKASWLAKAFEK